MATGTSLNMVADRSCGRGVTVQEVPTKSSEPSVVDDDRSVTEPLEPVEETQAAPRWQRRRRLVGALIAVIVTAGLVAGASIWYSNGPGEDARPRLADTVEAEPDADDPGSVADDEGSPMPEETEVDPQPPTTVEPQATSTTVAAAPTTQAPPPTPAPVPETTNMPTPTAPNAIPGRGAPDQAAPITEDRTVVSPNDLPLPRG
jgi:hypothetical protein